MKLQDIINSIRQKHIRITDHADEKTMKPFEKCPVCGGELLEKEVEKLLRGGVNTAVLKIHAEVCLQCGERLYPAETVRRFEQIRQKLERREVAEFQLLGQTYQVA